MSTALFDLSGKTALITGSSKGIGLALAKGLAQAGATIILNGRQQSALHEAKTTSQALANAHTLVADVSDPNAVQTMFETLDASRIGPVDILINNAGMQHRTPLEDFPIDAFDQMLRLNIGAAFYVAQQAAKRMIERGDRKSVV